MRKLFLILFLLIASFASAEKWALLVGINDYPNILAHYDIVWLCGGFS